jgi:hypothetical protein
MMTAGNLEAQVATTSWQNAIGVLAGSDGQLPTVVIPSGVLSGAQGSASWNMSRASLMLFAADSAKHSQFLVRSSQLSQEAEKSLIAAQQAGLPAAQGSQCDYLLGFFAEHTQNNLTSAESYYQQAASLDPTNSQATNALNRVQMYLAWISRL